MGRWRGACVVGLIAVAVAVPAPAGAESVPLVSSQQFGGPVHVPPLDSAVTWTRDRGAVLSLDSEDHRVAGAGTTGVFVFSRATDAPGARVGDSTGASVFQYANGSNDVWTAAYHAETHVGQDWYNQLAPPNPRAGGTHILYNGEASKWAPAATVIGLELNAVQQNTNPDTPMTPYPPDVGVDVQGRWRTGIDLHGNDVARAGVVSAAAVSTGSLNVGVTRVQSAEARVVRSASVAAGSVSAGRVYLASGVWIDFARGRVCVHRRGRVVARF